MKPEVIFKKLLMHKAEKYLIYNAPKEFINLLKDHSYDHKLIKKHLGSYDFVMVFASSQKEMEKVLKEVNGYGIHDCLFWACYPKGTGKIKTDINRNKLFGLFPIIEMKAVSNVAIDDTWSALRARPTDI